MLQFGRGEMSEYISCGYCSHIYRINNNLFLWNIANRTYCICICVFNYEFSLLGNNFYKFVFKLTRAITEDHQLIDPAIAFLQLLWITEGSSSP
jgi:hypothetical protein